MYAQDQNQRMCTANDALTTTPPGWLLGPSVPTVVTNSILVQRGYITQPAKMFKCPSDKGKRTDAQHIVPAIFSYARNGEILEMYPDSASQVSPNLGEIKYPAKTMMLMELHDSHPFNDGTTMRWPVDWITDRHLGQGGMSFFDGHVVMMKAAEYNVLAPDDKVDRYLNPAE
jgi:prepilin-type processing-associated H-X9-DG protein